MIKNYFLIAFRNLTKNKVFSFLNIAGLSVGLTCFILISGYVYHELHFDAFPKRSADIYRVSLRVIGNGVEEVYPNADVAVGAGMKAEYPDVQQFTRILKQGPGYMKFGANQFKEKNLAFVDANFLEFFSIPLLKGNAGTALQQPNSIVLTNQMARKYFGNQEAIGQSIEFGNRVLQVTGIMSPIPESSHFHFDALGSMVTFQLTQPTWSNIGFYTYLQLREGTDPKKLDARFPELVAKYVVPEVQHDMGVSLIEAQKTVNTFRFVLQPLRDIHLRSNTKYELEPNGDIRYVYIFSALAIFILLLACINFTNLSTARSAGRSKEIGIRKVMGSLRQQLISQFLIESILMTVLALLLALGLVGALLPSFNSLAGRQFSAGFFFNGVSLFLLLILSIVVGSFAGIYPAIFLSSFNPIRVLKGAALSKSASRNYLRSSLVIFQFFVSTSLMIATVTVYRQLHFMQDKKLGYDKEQVMYVADTYLIGARDVRSAFRESLAKDSRVVNASIGIDIPGNQFMDGTQIYPKEKHGNENDVEIHTNIFHVDFDYLSTLGIKLIRGRNFSRDLLTDSSCTIINEAAVRDLGWQNTDPIGKLIVGSGRREFRVIGVVADFHYASVKEKIAPVIMRLDRPGPGLIIKVKAAHVQQFVADLQKQWKTLNASAPFSYYFLNEQFAALYSAEQKTAFLFTVFAAVAILIASLGLFGLAAYSTEQRTREIGIRKVLGASLQQILVLVSKEFLLLVLIACLLSIPFSWWAMSLWLREFAYKTPVGAGEFVIAALVSIAIALITISFKAIGSALANPVYSLKEN